MEIRVLRYFLAVVREGGVNRAAEVLHITQPTLSRQLAQLEEEIGVKLFHRGARKITLTNEGVLLRRRAEEILALVDRTEKELVEQDEIVSAKDLENLPLILPRRTNVQNELANWLGDSFQSEKVLFTSNLSTNGALMVQKGLAYSIAIEGSVPFLDKEKITYRPLYPELTASSVLAWKKQQPFSMAAGKLIEYMKCFLGIGNV